MIISSNYDIIFNRIFILRDVDDPYKLYITYNIKSSYDQQFLPNTLSVHRKKNTNTIYTINALNQMIIEYNGGLLDTSYKIPWDDYYNTIIF